MKHAFNVNVSAADRNLHRVLTSFRHLRRDDLIRLEMADSGDETVSAVGRTLKQISKYENYLCPQARFQMLQFKCLDGVTFVSVEKSSSRLSNREK
jgi:hypothetical protein